MFQYNCYGYQCTKYYPHNNYCQIHYLLYFPQSKLEMLHSTLFYKYDSTKYTSVSTFKVITCHIILKRGNPAPSLYEYEVLTDQKVDW